MVASAARSSSPSRWWAWAWGRVPCRPGASAGGKEVSDTEAASLYGGACDVQSILPNTMPWCGPTGACGTVQVPVDIGTTDKITVAVQCGNSMNCNVYPIQIDRCGT